MRETSCIERAHKRSSGYQSAGEVNSDDDVMCTVPIKKDFLSTKTVHG